jgi:hypothetical protein
LIFDPQKIIVSVRVWSKKFETTKFEITKLKIEKFKIIEGKKVKMNTNKYREVRILVFLK